MLNGTVFIRLPAGFIALESDTATIGNSTEKALGSVWQKPDTLVFTNLNLTAGQKIIVNLKNKEVPAGGQYEFSSTSDADDNGPKLPTLDAKTIFASDSLRTLKEITNYSIPEYGSKAGTTKISNLSFDGLGDYITGGYKWLIKVQDGQFTTVPKFNDVLSTTEYLEYEANQNIPVVAGQYLMLAAVDATNKVKAYTIIKITNGLNADGTPNDTVKMIRPDDADTLEIGTNYKVVSGVQAGTVGIESLNYAGAHHFMIKIQDTPLSTVFVNTKFEDGTVYTSGDIKVSANQHIILAAVDSNNLILAYKDIQVTTEISEPAGILLPGNNFAAPTYGSTEGNTMIEWMKKGDINGGFTGITNWMMVVLSKDVIIPAKYASTTDYEKYYTEGKTFSGYAEKANIAVALGQHILLVGVDSANKIQAYADIIIGTDAVRQADAPLIPSDNFATPVMGSTQYTTMIPTLDFDTAISGATKYMVKVQDKGLAEAPQLNSTLSSTIDSKVIDCVAKQNIVITAGQHLILIATDGDGKIKAYQDILVDNANNTQIRPKDALNLNIPSTDYLPGKDNGTTSIKLASDSIAGFKAWRYKIGSASFEIPYNGSSITDMTELDYKSGADIPISVGQHLLIIAVDVDGKTLAYTQQAMVRTQIKQAKATVIPDSNCSAPVAGLVEGTTRIMSMNFQGINGAEKWLYQIASAPVAAPDYDSIVSGTPYAYSVSLGGESIAITINKYIVLYAVDSQNRVKAYKNIQVTNADQIKTDVPMLNTDTGYKNYSDPIKGTKEGTTKIATLSFGGIVGQAPLRWEYVVRNEVLIAPAINTTLAAIGLTTQEYVPNRDIGIKSGQFILLLAVDGNNVIRGYANIKVSQSQITPDNAYEMTTDNYSLIQGAKEGTTRFEKLNRTGLSNQASQWWYKVQKEPFNNTPVGDDTKVTSPTYIKYSDILMPDIAVSADWHILLLATDSLGYVKAFKDITVAKGQIKNPFAMELITIKNYTGPQQGTSPGAISITLKATDILTEDTIEWKYKIGGTTPFAAPHLEDDASGIEYHQYVSNNNIQFVANNYIMVVAVNSNNKIKAYKQFKITDEMIMPAEAVALTGENYTAPVPGSKPGTTKIVGLNEINLSSDFHHWVIKAVDLAQTLTLNSFLLYPDDTDYTKGEDISVKENQFVLLAAVDAGGRVKASAPRYGTKVGTTAIYISNEGISKFDKFMLKVVSLPKDIIAGEEISAGATIDSDYSSFRSYDGLTGADITATEGQYLLIVAVDSNNLALAYENIKLENCIRPGNAKLLTSPKNYLALKPGTGIGTTVISGLDSFDISPSFSKWAIKAEDIAPAIPIMNMNSSGLNVQEYIGSTKTIEIKVTQGQVVQLYALDASGYIKGYAFIPVGEDSVKGVAPRINPVPVPGTILNTTILEASVLNSSLTNAKITGATAWKYTVLDSAPADILKDSNMKTWGAAYNPGDNIVAAEGKHLVLVAIDGTTTSLAKAYADIILDSSMLKGIAATITGTITDSTGESDIAAGGRTIIITLDSGEWVDDVLTNKTKRDMLFSGFKATGTEFAKWDTNVVINTLIKAENPAVSMSIDKKTITITLSKAAYDITRNQQVLLTVKKDLIKNAVKDVNSNDIIKISADVVMQSLAGTAVTSGLSESDIIAGGKTIIIKLTNGEFAQDVASNTDKRNAIFDGFKTSNTDTAMWDKVIAALKLAANADLTNTKVINRNDYNQITIKLPPVAGYKLGMNELISLTVPYKTTSGEILVGAINDAVAPTPIIISSNTSVSLSGTLISTKISETDIVLGGKTLIMTLTKGQWSNDIATDKTKREALISGISVAPVVSTAETAQWTKVISALNAASLLAGQKTVERTSDNTVTITLPYVPAYDIAANQTITVNIPASSIIGAKDKLTTGQNITIERVATAVLTGTLGGSTEADIRTGGKKILITLKDATFVNTVGTSAEIKEALLDGLKADINTAAWGLVVKKLKETTGSVQKTSATVVTITLPSVDYNITANETISATVPTCAAIGISVDIKATGTLAIIDTVAPSIITEVNVTTPKTSYKIGETVTINVIFDKEVQVNGTTKPVIKLTTGKNATYAGGSGSKVLTFTYPVQVGEKSQYLDYPNASSIQSGIIVNAGTSTTVTRTLPLPSGGKSLRDSNIYIDGVIPVFTTGYPKVGEKTDTEANFLTKVGEEGTLHYVVLPTSVAAPNSTQVMAKKDSSGNPALTFGELPVLINTETTFKVSGLEQSTKYNIYMVVVDSVGNVSVLKTLGFETADLTAPGFVTGPVQGTISDNKIDIVMTLDENATVYMIALPVDSTAPTSAQVKEFKDASGNTVTSTNLKISKAVTKNVTTLSFTGLSFSSHYDIYVVCEDASKNLIANPAKIRDAMTSKLILTNVGVNVAQKLITNTSALMQYSLNGDTWKDCDATSTGIPYDDNTEYLTIYIREKADITNTIPVKIISRGIASVIDINKIEYDFSTKMITNSNTVSATDSTVLALEYRMNGGTWKTLNKTAENVEFTYGDWHVRTAATASSLPSLAVRVADIAVPNSAPTMKYNDYTNIIDGMDSSLEYIIDGGTWTNGTINGDFAGTKKVEIREKATKDKLASYIQTINFTACSLKVVASPAAANTTTNMNTVTLTFEEITNMPAFTVDSFKNNFLVGKWDSTGTTQTTVHDWGNDINEIKWTSGNVLKVTFKSSAMTGLTVKIGDEVRVGSGAGIRKAGTAAAANYTLNKGTLTGSFHTTPILSVKAVNSDNKVGFGNGDKIVIAFDQLTNEADITALTMLNIDTFLKVTDSAGIDQNWGVVNNSDIVWSKSTDNTKSILTITFNNVSATQVSVNDRITVNPAWGLKDVDNTTAACSVSALVSGSFTSSPEIDSAVYSGNTVTITFDQATNKSKIEPIKINEWLMLTGADGTPHSWGIKNDQTITWVSDTVLTITLISTEGRTIKAGDTLTLNTYATIKAKDNGTQPSSASFTITDH